MADVSILAGATSQSILVDLYIQATGAAQTGLVYNSTGLIAYYSFVGANSGATSITLATQSTGTAWATGGFVELSSTHMPGVYNFDIPNAVIAASKGREVFITFSGYSGMATRTIKIELTGWDNQNATNGGISALPATACTSNASLITSGTGTAQITLSSGAVLLQATQTGVTIPTVTTVTNQLTAAAIATGVWTDTTAGDFTTSASIGKSVMNGVALGTGLTINGYTGNTVQTGDSYARIGATGSGLTSLATPTNITGGTITTVTNLTNAPTSGDFTSTMKTSIGTAVAASAVASVTGNIGGNVIGSVASVTAPVGITSNRKKSSTATFEFTMNDSTTGADKTGLTVASVISKDGGAFANTSNSVTEVANGWYQLVLTGTEMAANNIALHMTAAAATARDISIQTQP